MAKMVDDGLGFCGRVMEEVLKRLQSCDPRTLAGLSGAHSTPSKSDPVAWAFPITSPKFAWEKHSLSLPLSVLCSWQLGKESETKVPGKVKFSINWCE